MKPLNLQPGARIDVDHRPQGLFLAGRGRRRFCRFGILVAPGRFMTGDFELNDRARAWIRAKPRRAPPSSDS